MVDKEKLIAYLNGTKEPRMFIGEKSRIKWEGFIPDGVELVAMSGNTFASKKNMQAFIDMINALESPVSKAAEAPALAPTLQEVVEKYDIITDEVSHIKSKGPRRSKAVA